MSLAVKKQVLLPRICVQPPYFALTDIEIDDHGTLTCTAPVELPPGPESPVAAAEAARHCAIAGLCAVTAHESQDQRRYYLAKNATLERSAAPGGEALALTGIEARGRPTSEGSAEATVRMYAGGRTLFRLTIEYFVLTDETFTHVFRHLERADPGPRPPGYNPYTAALPLRDERVGHDRAAAEVRAPAAQCVGHFPGYPALPVAYLLTAEFELGADLARRRLGGHPVVPVIAHLDDARTLLPPEQPTLLRAAVAQTDDRECLVEITAAQDDEVAIRTRVSYRAVSPANGA